MPSTNPLYRTVELVCVHVKGACVLQSRFLSFLGTYSLV